MSSGVPPGAKFIPGTRSGSAVNPSGIGAEPPPRGALPFLVPDSRSNRAIPGPVPAQFLFYPLQSSSFQRTSQTGSFPLFGISIYLTPQRKNLWIIRITEAQRPKRHGGEPRSGCASRWGPQSGRQKRATSDQLPSLLTSYSQSSSNPVIEAYQAFLTIESRARVSFRG
jgi:hypothetical protein